MNRKIGLLISAMALLLLTAACSKNNKKTASTEPSTKAPAVTTTTSSAAGTPGSIITGKVLETKDAGGYTYLHLDEGTQKVWAAVPKVNVKVGDKVSIVFSMLMKNFKSKTLGRTFDELIFSSGLAPSGSKQPITMNNTSSNSANSSSFAAAVKAAGGKDVASATGGSEAAVVPAAANLKVKKASGANGYTIAQLFAKKAELNGKEVRLRGKVVKVSKNIMGKNWIHLQDGTSDPKTKAHDFVVTTTASPEKNQIVTVSGKLEANKDFGAGYVYDAIIENATVK